MLKELDKDLTSVVIAVKLQVRVASDNTEGKLDQQLQRVGKKMFWIVPKNLLCFTVIHRNIHMEINLNPKSCEEVKWSYETNEIAQ